MTKNDPAKLTAFSNKMTDILNYGALNLAMAIGYRVRLFETLASFDQPMSTTAIAESAGLSERYVREWLGVMYTGGIVDHSRDQDNGACYYLPPEHASMLSARGEGPNLGVYTQEIPLLTNCSMEAVTESFKSGDGVPYASYPTFQAFMAELANAKHRESFLEKFIPAAFGGGLPALLLQGIRVCDFGCGEGVANREHPMGPFLYTVSLMHCLPVGLVDGGAGLGMRWGQEKAVQMLRRAGFSDISVEEIEGDPFNLHFCCRKTGRLSG